MMQNFDATIEVRFNTSDEGGRNTNISGTIYSCPLFVDGEAFDCRVYIKDGLAVLGQKYLLPIKFLNRDAALSVVRPGKYITLWEGKTVATGRILEIMYKT